MSVYYTVKEHLTVNNNFEHPFAAGSMKHQLALLGSMLLLDEAVVHSIRLTADGESYTFSGKEINSDYHSILRALGKAEKIDLAAEYGVTWRIGYDDLDVGPVAMCEVMEEALEEDPSVMENVFYSAYREADCDEGNGTLFAFGARNGKQYNGEVEYTETAEFPDGGVWQTEASAVTLDIEDIESVDIQAIDSICKELWDSFSTCEMYSLNFTDGKISTGERIVPETFIGEEGGFSFHLENAQLKSADDFRKFIILFEKLDELANGECGYLFEFADWSGDDARLIRIEYDDSGKCIVKLAEIK